jgi:hypothetical protein
LLPPPKGSVLTFDTKGAIATHPLPGCPVRGWMDWSGQRLCRPPAEEGIGRALLPGRWWEEVGRSLRKRRGHVLTERTRSLPGRWAARKGREGG